MLGHAFVRRLPALGLAALVALAPGALGDVADVGEQGFTIRATVALSVPPAKAYAALADVGKWWDGAHTYSSDAANLSLDPKPGGCWCEKLPGGGGVQHMTVVYVSPGKVLRLTGGLGPLQSLAVAGSMTWTFDATEKGTTVKFVYVAGGYNPGGFKDLAPGVDAVLKQQIERYKRYAETGKP